MAEGDACTCDGPWVAIEGAPPMWMRKRAVEILDEGHPDGFEVVELGPDGECYRYLREEHPPEPSIPHEHPGVTVTKCSGKAAPPPAEGGGGSSSEAPSPGSSSPPPSGPSSGGTCEGS